MQNMQHKKYFWNYLIMTNFCLNGLSIFYKKYALI